MAPATARVVTLTTNPAIDVALDVDALVPDHKLRARTTQREPGGGGVNVARVLRRFGIETAACVVVAGSSGDELLGLIEAEGVGTITVTAHGQTRESLAITDGATGRQYRIVLEGPVVENVAGLRDRMVGAAQGAGLVVLSGSLADGLPVDFLRTICAEVGGARTIVDCSGPPLAEAVLGSAFLVKPSRRELASLLSWTPATPEEIEIGAREVLERGDVEHLVVSLGPMGAVLVPRTGPSVWFSVPEVEVQSTIGAGDAMVAGVVAALAEGNEVVGAVRRGVAAGVATVASPGTALCDARSVERLERLVGVADAPPRRG